MSTDFINAEPLADTFAAERLPAFRKTGRRTPAGPPRELADARPRVSRASARRRRPFGHDFRSGLFRDARPADYRRERGGDRQLGYLADETKTMSLDDLLSSDAQGQWRAGIEQLLAGETLDNTLPARQRTKIGSSFDVQVQLRVIKSGEDEPLLVAVVQSTGDDRQLDELLERRGYCDYLTALPTRLASRAGCGATAASPTAAPALPCYLLTSTS